MQGWCEVALHALLVLSMIASSPRWHIFPKLTTGSVLRISCFFTLGHSPRTCTTNEDHGTIFFLPDGFKTDLQNRREAECPQAAGLLGMSHQE